MLIRSHIGAPATAPSLEPIAHGGDLAAARQMFPNAPEPFIDLSTGINPHPYPLPPLPAEIFARLPDRASVRRLAAMAARSYGAPVGGSRPAAPGHANPAAAGREAGAARARSDPPHDLRGACARRVAGGAQRHQVPTPISLRDADLAIVVNPNNPDGRIVPRDTLLTHRRRVATAWRHSDRR